MATRHINRSAVRKAMIHDMAIEILEEIYAGVSGGNIENHPKFSLRLSGDPRKLQYLNSMPAYLPVKGYAGIKWASVNSENSMHGMPTVMGMIILNDPDNGYPLAVMDGGYISSWRTGVTTGMCAYYFADRTSQVLTVIGPGENNFHALEYLLLGAVTTDRLTTRPAILAFVTAYAVCRAFAALARSLVYPPGLFTVRPETAVYVESWTRRLAIVGSAEPLATSCWAHEVISAELTPKRRAR